jgi:hypothetical protein
VSFISSLSRDLCASQAEEDAEDEAEVRNSYLLQLLRPHSRRAHRKKLLVGLERPTTHFGHGTVCKSGVAPAHPRVLPASKLIVAPRASPCSLGTCSVAKVTARVTHMVICVFHAPVTFPCPKCDSNAWHRHFSSTTDPSRTQKAGDDGCLTECALDCAFCSKSRNQFRSRETPILIKEHRNGKK